MCTLLLLLSTSWCVSALTKSVYHFDPNDAHLHFEEFVTKYNKQYASHNEKEMPLEMSKNNLENHLNENSDHAVFDLAQSVRLLNPKVGDLNLVQEKLQPPRTFRQEYLQQLQPVLKPIQQKPSQQEKVKIQLFYESLCPSCRVFDTEQLAPTIIALANYLDVNVYPYGNAKTNIQADGKIEVKCQHGPAECYGNMLHACAIDLLGNITQAIEFNACMMGSDQEKGGSNNNAADTCGKLMNIDSEPIKRCATSERGLMLLKQYGDESKKVGFNYVPYILINGQRNSGENFMRDVCDAFQNPPPECNKKI